MATMDLAAERRHDTGKEVNRKRRAAGRVPGVIYGRGLETRSLEFERKPLEKFLESPGAARWSSA
jgi:large subunit ribosomal protein L25